MHAQIIGPHFQEEVVSHFFNTANNLDYVSPYPKPKYSGADFISCDERAQFSDWYEGVREKINNKENLLAYCTDDVNVLWEEIIFGIGQDGTHSSNHYNIVHLQ